MPVSTLKVNYFVVLFCLATSVSCIRHSSNNEKSTQQKQPLPEFSYLTGVEFKVTDNDTMMLFKHPQNETVYNSLSVRDELHLPLSRVVIFSATHVPYLSKLNSLNVIKGMAHPEYSLNDSLHMLLNNNQLKDVTGAREADFEKTISCEPEAIFVFPFGTADYSSYTELDIAVLNITEYLEKHPLGKAEWLKVFGYLIGKQDVARAKFEVIESQYLSLKDKAEQSDLTVFTGEPFKGLWNQPSGSSYMAHIIEDAGLHYLWKDSLVDKNLELSFEEVYHEAIDADVWFIAAPKPENYTLKDLINSDGRYEKLQSVKQGNVYLCNTAKVDYFGEGSVSPHLLLEDFILAAKGKQGGNFFKKLN